MQIEALVGLLVAVAVLTWLAQRIKVEYPILLVIGGLILGFIPGLPQIVLQPNVVFLVFLPPLLYYEAFNSSIRDFKSVLRLIIMNAVFLVIVTIAAVAVTAHALIPGLGWAAAIVLGAIVGPTDETAAIEIVSRLSAPRRLITLIKAESLFNDATSLVIFNVALAAAVTGAFSWASGIWQLFADAIGGVVIGLAVGWLIGLIRRHLDDVLLQNTVSLLSGYAAYYPADALHFSGVLAAITTGLYLGRQSHLITSPSARVQITAMRDITLYLINGVLFILVGLQLHPILVDSAKTSSLGNLMFLAVAISLTIIIVRILWIVPAVYLPRIVSARIRANEGPPSWRNALVVAWTGMRGGVSLAAALAIPLTVSGGAPFPHRPLILFLTFAVILATLVAQGLTLPLLIRLLHIEPEKESREESLARLKLARTALSTLERVAEEPWAQVAAVRDARDHLEHALAHYKDTQPETSTPEQQRNAQTFQRIQHELTQAQTRELTRLHNEGAITNALANKLQRELDFEALRIEGEG